MKKTLPKQVIYLTRLFTVAFILQFLTMSFLLAWNGNAQVRNLEDVKVYLSLSDVSIEKAFKELENHTNYNFVFASREIKDLPLVTFKSDGQSLYNILLEIAAEANLSFKQVDLNIHVKQSDKVLSEDFDVIVTGIVTDANGEPIPGATVSIPGTGIGTATDIDGKYSLSVPEGSTLVFSFIGFVPQSIAVGDRNVTGQNTIHIILEESVAGLDEVVVVGYGTQKRHEITGSVASVSPDEFNGGVVSSPDQLLVGKVAGLVINRPGGDPTAGSTIQLRGPSSLTASSEPLYVIDGVPGASIDLLAPEDIASIDILKDASSAAIYGSRAANGVILITTKKGTPGKAVLNYSAYTAFENIARGVDVLSPAEFRKFVADNDRVVNGIENGYNTDWQNEIYRNAVSQNHSLSLRGGSESSTYNASLTYFNNPGIVKNNSYERMVGRLALTQDLFNERVKFGLSLSTSINNSNHINYGVFANSALYLPIYPVTSSDPQFDMYGGYYQLDGVGGSNPVAMLNQRHEDRQRNVFLGNASLDIKILPDLNLNLSGTLQRQDDDRNYYMERGDVSVQANGIGYAERSSVKNTDNTFESVLNYSKVLNEDHDFKALLGYSYQEVIINDGISGTQNTFSSDAIGSGNLSFGQGDATLHYRDFPEKAKSQLLSYFGRFNYSFKGKYILSGTLRRDGSSKFGVNNRWAMFPSAGAAWRVSEEGFLRDHDWISDLSFRAGFGVSGNQNIPPYRSMTLYGPQGSQFLYNGEWTNSYSVIQNPNPDLKWESTQMLNIGLDFEIFSGVLGGTIEYYSKETNDLLYTYDVPTPPYQFNRLLANGASMTNKGIEVALIARIINKEDFKWNSSANFSSNKNRIGSLSSNVGNLNVTERLEGGVGLSGWTGQYVHLVRPGLAVGTFNTVKYLGFDSDLQQTIYENGNGEIVTLDKLITPNDYQIVGDALPKYTFGWSNSLQYKRVDLNIFLRGVYGNKIFNATRANLSRLDQIGTYNVLKIAAEEGIFETPVASSRWVEDGSFIRLDNATLGYNLNMTGVKGISAARIYFTAQNIFTITNYTGVDPEVSLGGLAPGIDNQNYYPKTRSYTIGVNVSF